LLLCCQTPQGIHTASALWNTQVEQGSWPVDNGFAVQEVIDMIKTHNKDVLRK
jgi:3-deoxy-D-manno-octulosonic-acid transferase